MPTVLVLQHPQLPQCDLRFLSTQQLTLPHITQNHARISVAEGFRLPPECTQALDQQKIDHAVLPDVAFDEIGLIVSDMDSTFITIECIDEIAQQAGIKAQVCAITERAMRGELDFEQSLRQRVRLLKGLPETALQTVYDEVLQLTAGAPYLIEQCQQHSVPFMLVSGGFTFFTQRLQTRLGLNFAYANQLASQDGKLTGEISGKIIDAQAKADLLQQHRQRLPSHKKYVVAVGDGANDIPMLQTADFGIAYHAKPKTQQHADILIQYNGLNAVRHWFR